MGKKKSKSTISISGTLFFLSLIVLFADWMQPDVLPAWTVLLAQATFWFSTILFAIGVALGLLMGWLNE